MRNVSMKVLLFAAVMLGFAASYAASWPSSGPARKVTTLIVCTNNKSPRLLAETIQSESKQPFLLLPATQSDDTRIFFVPSKGAAEELNESEVNSFILFLNPKRVVVLGNDNIVPRRYLENLDRTIPVVTFDGKDWNRVAEELGSMLNLSAVPQDYKRLREDLLSDSKIYRPVSKPAKAKVDIKAEPKLEEVAPAAAATDKDAGKDAAPKAEAPKADAAK